MRTLPEKRFNPIIARIASSQKRGAKMRTETKVEKVCLEKWVIDYLLDLTKEAISYTPQLFRDKWDMDRRLKNLSKKIEGASK